MSPQEERQVELEVDRFSHTLLWAMLPELPLAFLLDRQPKGWLDAIPYHRDQHSLQVVWDEGKYYLQLDATRIKETDKYTALKLLRALSRARKEELSMLEKQIEELSEYEWQPKLASTFFDRLWNKYVGEGNDNKDE